jgi:hypothetical protein
MENVGYTNGGYSATNYQKMRAEAIAHSLSGRAYIESRKSNTDCWFPSSIIPYMDVPTPQFLGHTRFFLRRGGRENIVRGLTATYYFDGWPFIVNDSEFPFVYYNILRKRQGVESANFGIKFTHQQNAITLFKTKAADLQQSIVKYEDDLFRQKLKTKKSNGFVAKAKCDL